MDICDLSFIIPRQNSAVQTTRSSSSFDLNRTTFGHDRSRTLSTATSVSTSPRDPGHAARHSPPGPPRLPTAASTTSTVGGTSSVAPNGAGTTPTGSRIFPSTTASSTTGAPATSTTFSGSVPLTTTSINAPPGIPIRDHSTGTRRSTASSITIGTDPTSGSAHSVSSSPTALTQLTSTHSRSQSSSLTAGQRTAELHEACDALAQSVMLQHQCVATLWKSGPEGQGKTTVSATGPGTAVGEGGPRKRGSQHSLSGVKEGIATQAATTTSTGVGAVGSRSAATGGAGKTPLTQEDGDVQVLLNGPYNDVLGARGQILREHPFSKQCTVKVPRKDVLDARGALKPEWKGKMDEISASMEVHLGVKGVGEVQTRLGLETERSVEIVITGPYENIEQAKVKLLVMLDTLDSLHFEFCELDYKLHNLIAGRKRCNINNIQRETATNIYFPTPLSGVLDVRNANVLNRRNLVFISGEFFGAQRARDTLMKMCEDVSDRVISRATSCLAKKIDWLMTEKLDEVRQIMTDNGTFINFPLLGSGANHFTVYGEHPTPIERTLRSIMALAAQYLQASVYSLPPAFPPYMPHQPHQPIPRAQIPAILKQLVLQTGVEATYKNDCFDFYGTEQDIRAAVQSVLNLDVLKNFQHEVRFHIELANEHKEFFTGKKNGKTNRIQKATNTRIKCREFNDWNFVIELVGADAGVLQAFAMLQDELPAEMTFYIPETYHKRIIGVSGKNIQRMMKKFDVYVKFSNAEEFAQLGGYGANEDNVLVRTPAKNAKNMELLKAMVMESVSPKDKDYTVETVAVPRRYHRKLVGEKIAFLRNIELKTSCAITFPSRESGSDLVRVYGPEAQAATAAQALLDLIPYEAEYRIPHSDKMAKLVVSPDFVHFLETIKRDFNVAIAPWVDRTGSNDETIIRFSLNRGHLDYLNAAKEAIEEYLTDMQVDLYPSAQRSRADSYDSFQYFPTKLLSNVGGDVDARSNFDFQERTLRAASSTPDIKALFDGPTYGLHNMSAAPQLPPPHEPEYNYYTPFPTQRPSIPEYSYYAPRQPHMYATPMSAYPMMQQPHLPRMMDASPYPRMDDRYISDASRKPRTLGPRAQSLDLSHALQAQAQALAAAPATGPPAPAPGSSFGYRHHAPSMSFGTESGSDQLNQVFGQMSVRH